ncbi:MAG: hypothetical protein QOH71_204 [Blastocatellia bacterium]|jgi:hypothetical protein|nr:hypothetical protein [Blastocatellia bacterium]
MMKLSLTGNVCTGSSRFPLGLILLALLSMNTGCSFSAKPSKSVETLCRAVESGEVDRAATYFSSGFISKLGIEVLKENLSRSALELKEHGGIKSIKVLKEEVVGDVAEVTIEITRGNGNITPVHYKLIKDQGAWKVDGVSVDSGQANEPLHPESAVEDVVKWARDAGASSLKSWLQKQPAPPFCTAPAVDRNALPDEVKYHVADDTKIKERLLTALDPVLKLVGCSNAQGLVLYKGPTVYAFNLGKGQIAITPGDSYFGGFPPDEKIFHSLAELRIFLAREVFRQMVPVEKASAGLNESDMWLRRELKLSYLATIMSLTLDHDPAMLDSIALDVELYGKPFAIASGTQGAPDLDQIKDVFGAAKQDYRE